MWLWASDPMEMWLQMVVRHSVGVKPGSSEGQWMLIITEPSLQSMSLSSSKLHY